MDTDLAARSGDACELCGETTDLSACTLSVAPTPDDPSGHAIMACATCRAGLDGALDDDRQRWRCLNDVMWSAVPAVQVGAFRLLSALAPMESWARDALDSLYLDEDTLAWAQAGLAPASSDDAGPVHRDCNGAILTSGDTVTLIKDLDVKGANFTAKRGTPVRNITLVPDVPEHIEGRVNGQTIVILTRFVRRSS